MTANDISDICYSYKYAAHKSEMLQILSELYCCKVADIKELLEQKGFEIEEQKKKCNGGSLWLEEEKQIVRDCLDQSMSFSQITKTLNDAGFKRTRSGVVGMVRKLKSF
ncbi:MAG: hypothetical protein KBT46_00695 [Ruminococcus sp.]|nr:hypothetical protein [Candidatus Copronaster equi]